jgi:hypothetical protein
MIFIFTYLLEVFHNIVNYFYIGYCEEYETSKEIDIIALTTEQVISYEELIKDRQDIKEPVNDEEHNWELI